MKSGAVRRVFLAVVFTLFAPLFGGWLAEPSAAGVYVGTMEGARGEVDVLFEIKDRGGEISGEVRFDGSEPTKIEGKRWKETVSIKAAFSNGGGITWYGRLSLVNRRMSGTFTYKSAAGGDAETDAGEWKVKRQ